MKEYLKVAKQIMVKFSTKSVTQVARGRNRHADSLATLASAMTEDIPRQIKVQIGPQRLTWQQLSNFSPRIEYRMMKARLTRSAR